MENPKTPPELGLHFINNGESSRTGGAPTTEGHVRPDGSREHVVARPFRLQGKRFFFTWPRCDVPAETALERIMGWRPVDRCMVARERHGDGAFHLHAAIWLKKRMDVRTLTAIDAILGQHGSYETMRDPVGAVKYLMKEDTNPAVYGFDPEEYVQAAARKRVSRTGGAWNSVIQFLREGNSLVDFEDQAFVARNLRHLQRYDDWVRSERPTYRVGPWRIRVLVVWGPTGLYKSTWARNLARGPSVGHGLDGDTYVLPYQRSGTTWWERYRGQRILVLDDFDPSKMPLLQLLRVLDNFEFVGEVKGASVSADWIEVIITNNIHPDRWYPTEGPERMAALLRRMKIVHVGAGDGDWCTHSFDEIFTGAHVLPERPEHSSNLVTLD